MSDHAGKPQGPPPPQSNEYLLREVERLREELQRSERARKKLERDQDRLRQRYEHVKRQLEAARRAGFRQAAPFSRGAPKSRPAKPGRKRGAEYGRKARRRKPPRIDVQLEAALPTRCPDCGGSIVEDRVEPQFQTDIPLIRPIVRQFNIHIGHCTQCEHRVQGRHPLQTSDAIGAARSQVGPQVVALAVFLNKALGLSFGKVSTLLLQRFGLKISRGGLVQALHRAARRAEPSYEALIKAVRGSPMVVPDETGWKVNAQLQWLHVAATPDTTVYLIAPGRGFEEASALLGSDYDGTIVRDGWAPYRRFTAAEHQTCVAHLLRRCNELIADHPQARLPREVKVLIQTALRLRDRFNAGTVTQRGLASARGQIIAEMVRVLESPGAVPAVVKFARHLTTEFTALFTFLFEPGVDATNWRAETALRPAVITRKVCGGGNRTARGAQTQQVLVTVLRSSAQRGKDAEQVLVPMLRSPVPIVPHALRPPVL